MRVFFAVFGVVAAVSSSPIMAQSLNEGYAAMDRGDFYAAFSAMRRLEQAGDPNAARLLEEIFLTPGAASPEVVAPAPAPSAPERVAAPPPVITAPARSPRPEGRATVQPVALPVAAPVRPLAAPGRVRPLPPPLTDADFRPIDAALADQGHLLFFDPLLSGNRDISCASCHHPSLGSSDGLSLGLGTGAAGLGAERAPLGPHPANVRVPRNAPGLWNLGARAVHRLFHDGRLEHAPERVDARLSPQGPLEYMQLESILAAQVLFPLIAVTEMAGRPGENPVADAVAEERIHGDDGAWALIAARVDDIPAYRAGFAAARGAEAPLRIDEIANAIAAFIEAEFRADQTPFDAYLREEAAMSAEAGEGMRLFYGRAGCAGCHSGPLLSDQQFHAMGQPPLGPGAHREGPGYTPDLGRGGVTLEARDNFAFRTPMLRNVMQTGPWGHSGAFSDIRAFLRHHLDPVAGLDEYAPQARLPVLAGGAEDYAPLGDAALMAQIRAAAARSMETRPRVTLQQDEIDLLVAFLETLTDETALAGRRGVPDTVPSGLPVAR